MRLNQGPLSQLKQTINSLFLRDMPKERRFSFIDRDFTASFTDITPISVCHLARTVDYASHHGDDSVFEMGGFRLDFSQGSLKIVHGPSASRACDIFRPIEPAPGRLQELVDKVRPFARIFNRDGATAIVKIVTL